MDLIAVVGIILILIFMFRKPPASKKMKIVRVVLAVLGIAVILLLALFFEFWLIR